MLFKRVNVMTTLNGGVMERSAQGSGCMEALDWASNSTDTNQTMTVAEMAGGGVMYTGFTAGRTITTPTATAITGAAPDMNIGESFSFHVSVTTAFALTWAAGSGVTLAGKATTAASGYSLVTVKKATATTYIWRVA